MATLRGNRLIILIGLALIATFLLVATDSTFAQEKHKISWTAKAEHTKYTFQHSFEIPDISDTFFGCMSFALRGRTAVLRPSKARKSSRRSVGRRLIVSPVTGSFVLYDLALRAW